MRITEAELGALGIVATLIAGLVAPVSARRETIRTRRHQWATQAADAWSQGRRAWSLCGPERLEVGAGAAEAFGLSPAGEVERRQDQINAAIDVIHAAAATCEWTESAAVAKEIARRLWLLDHAMVASLNLISQRRHEAIGELRAALAPLEAQAAHATHGSGSGTLEAKSLERLFDEFELAIRRAAST